MRSAYAIARWNLVEARDHGRRVAGLLEVITRSIFARRCYREFRKGQSGVSISHAACIAISPIDIGKFAEATSRCQAPAIDGDRRGGLNLRALARRGPRGHRPRPRVTSR